MNVLDRLWERISSVQPLPPAWVVGVTGLAALLVVLNAGSWRLAGKVITIAHEGGHALVSVLSGRRLEGIRLHADNSGVTYSRGRRRGPGLVLTASAGYVTPSARRRRGRPARGAAPDRAAVAGPAAAGRDVPGRP
jgi:Peptidase M50B-like